MNKKNYPKDYTVIDLETTGFSPDCCKILELSAIKVRNDEIVDTYSELINPHEKVHYFITNLTGINDEMLCDKLDINEVLPSYLDFIGDDILLGHNVTFDISFIRNNANKYLNREFNNRYFDTMYISRSVFKSERHHRLVDLIERCHLGGSQEHRGLSDCMYTYKAYLYMKELIGGKDGERKDNIGC